MARLIASSGHSGIAGKASSRPDSEVFAAHDRFLREPCGVVASQEREKAFGFAVEPQGLLASPERTLLPPSLVIYDPCHNYWANGIVAQEILSFCKAMKRKTAFSLQLIQNAVKAGRWTRCWMKRSKGETPSWTARLFESIFWEGKVYKRTASARMAVFPLLLFYAEWLVATEDTVRQEFESLRAPQRCASVLRKLNKPRSPGDDFAANCRELQKEQAAHHAAFTLAYPGGAQPFVNHVCDIDICHMYI